MSGLEQLLAAVAARMPPREVEAVYAFPPLTRADHEYGVAVVSRRAGGDRSLVYRARYVLPLRGVAAGRASVELEEAGEGPEGLAAAVVRGVERRAGEGAEAEMVDLSQWNVSDDERPGAG